MFYLMFTLYHGNGEMEREYITSWSEVMVELKTRKTEMSGDVKSSKATCIG